MTYSLLAEYDAWKAARVVQSDKEDAGKADADDWAHLDDQGCDLAHALADELRALTEGKHVVTVPFDAWDTVVAIGKNVLATHQLVCRIDGRKVEITGAGDVYFDGALLDGGRPGETIRFTSDQLTRIEIL